MCNIGYYGTAGSSGSQTSCTPCSNQYQDEIGQPSCKPCPHNIKVTVPETAASSTLSCGKWVHCLITRMHSTDPFGLVLRAGNARLNIKSNGNYR